MSGVGAATISWVLVSTLAATPAPAAADREGAMRQFELGEQQFALGRFDAAAEHFMAAWELFQDPAYLFNLGLSYERQARWALAVRYYERFLREVPDSPAAPEVERRLQAARASREASRATVVLTTRPAGATATLATDQEGPGCTTPCELKVDPGAVSVRLVLDGATRTVARSLAPGERWVVDESLVDAAPATGPPASGETPPTVMGGTDPGPGPNRTGSWLAFGAGGGALVAGAVLGGLALSDHKEGKALASELAVDTPELKSLRRRVKKRSRAADASFGLALAGVAVGTILWLVADEPADGPGVAQWRF